MTGPSRFPIFLSFFSFFSFISFFSLGLSTTGAGMYGADTMTFWVDGSGRLTAIDEWSSSESQPTADARQDLTDLRGQQSATTTTVAFSRLLVTGDSNDVPITAGSMWVQYAYHTRNDGVGRNYGQHTAERQLQHTFIPITTTTARATTTAPGQSSPTTSTTSTVSVRPPWADSSSAQKSGVCVAIEKEDESGEERNKWLDALSPLPAALGLLPVFFFF
jgi:hypothetical protein